MTVIILPTCPECGCSDIRLEPYRGYVCFKCGHIEKPDNTPKSWGGK